MSTFTILTVCTGNICRSPMAAHLLQQELTGIPGVRVVSAGTRAMEGASMHPNSRQITARLIPHYARDHVARQLAAEQIEQADLVLAMAREHRRGVAELFPRASRRSFTIREFVRLADEVQPDEIGIADPMFTDDLADRMRSGVDIVASVRGTLPPLVDPTDDDVIDPYGQSEDVYEASATQLVPAVRATAEFLRRAAAGGV